MTRWGALAGIIALILVGGIGLSLFFQQRAQPPGPQPPPSPERIARETALRLLELRNVGLAELENDDLTRSLPPLTEIADALPEDPFAPRNLVVAKILQAEKLDPTRAADERHRVLQEARTQLDHLRQITGETWLTHLLAGQIALRVPDEAAAMDELAQAAQLSPQDPALWYEVFLAGQYSQDEPRRQRAFAALEQAYQLAPTNLYVLTEWWAHQADAHDPKIVTTLEQARDTLRPFVETIRAKVRIDLLPMIDRAIDAARKNNWPVVLQSVRPISSVLRHEPVAQSDQRRVKRHPLEYVALDFGDDFYQQAELPPADAPPPIDVSFAPAETQPPESQNVLQVVAADFDLDRQLDLAVLRQRRLEVSHRGDNTQPWSLLMTADLPPGRSQLLIADLDDDADAALQPKGDAARPDHCHTADPDVIAFGSGGVTVLRNVLNKETRERSFEAVSQSKDLEQLKEVKTGALIDLDHDGDLDLALATQSGLSFWSNRGNLTFEDITTRSALPPADVQPSALVPVDWDRDGDLDLVVANQAGHSGYLENLRHARFRWREFPADAAGLAQNTALAVADVDGNASWDLIAAGPSGLTVTRTATTVPGSVRMLESKSIDDTPNGEVWTWDYDNDGYTDLLRRTEADLKVVRGPGGGRFEPQPALSESLPNEAAALSIADLDHDGDLDLALATPTAVRTLHNNGGNANHWLDISLIAQQVKDSDPSASGRVNHYGMGSLIEVKAGPKYQAQVVSGPTTHFGLGKTERADVARVMWTNGVPRNIVQPPSDTHLCEQQTLLGSCPYLYTWTGERYEFFTDLLWAAPIGLLFGEETVAPWREWEYLKIPGERLTAQDGQYRMRITEELWEAGYFDQVELIAVDHPADVEIFTNEKVGPPELAAHKIHTVRQRRLPIAARDKHGRDVLPIVAHEDQNYFKGYEQKYKQGLTEEHFLELDLGDLAGARRITLFLTGWVYPTDTSINVALSQNPDLDEPRPPSLWVPDEQSQWRQVRPFMGFPGGKTKTIAVDLSEAFLTHDYRLRIVTNMEFYWDAAFFTVDEEPAEYRETPLPLVSADLHERGFSRRVIDPGHGPETYDYSQVSREPHWPPMGGCFTRYGEVRELLLDWDDRLVVLGAGDEMSLAFQAPAEPLPAGWKRDFVLHNVGWDKDANLNTVYGETVEPLPFREMTVYAHTEGRPRPLDPRYAKYLRTYQTRRQTAGRYWFQIRDYQPASE